MNVNAKRLRRLRHWGGIFAISDKWNLDILFEESDEKSTVLPMSKAVVIAETLNKIKSLDDLPALDFGLTDADWKYIGSNKLEGFWHLLQKGVELRDWVWPKYINALIRYGKVCEKSADNTALNALYKAVLKGPFAVFKKMVKKFPILDYSQFMPEFMLKGVVRQIFASVDRIVFIDDFNYMEYSWGTPQELVRDHDPMLAALSTYQVETAAYIFDFVKNEDSPADYFRKDRLPLYVEVLAYQLLVFDEPSVVTKKLRAEAVHMYLRQMPSIAYAGLHEYLGYLAQFLAKHGDDELLEVIEEFIYAVGAPLSSWATIMNQHLMIYYSMYNHQDDLNALLQHHTVHQSETFSQSQYYRDLRRRTFGHTVYAERLDAIREEGGIDTIYPIVYFANNVGVLEILATHGFPIDEALPYILLRACRYNYKGIIKFCLERGVNPVEHGNDALGVACIFGHDELVKRLIRHGWDIQAPAWKGTDLCPLQLLKHIPEDFLRSMLNRASTSATKWLVPALSKYSTPDIDMNGIMVEFMRKNKKKLHLIDIGKLFISMFESKYWDEFRTKELWDMCVKWYPGKKYDLLSQATVIMADSQLTDVEHPLRAFAMYALTAAANRK